MSGCGCQTAQSDNGKISSQVVSGVPILDPQRELNKSNGENTMSETKPTLIPPTDNVSETGDSTGNAAPTLTPSSMAMEGGITAWINDKRVTALWSLNQNRNSWVYIGSVGWKKLSDNSDSAVVALSMLAAHAKQTQTNYSYREEDDGKIHEVYVW
jgi:hypothetical protein